MNVKNTTKLPLCEQGNVSLPCMSHPLDVVSGVAKGTLNLRECTMQEWTMRHHVTGVDFAGII